MAKTQKDKSPLSESCISRPANSRFIALREEYRNLCVLVNGGTGDRIATVEKLPTGKTKNTSYRIDGRAGKAVIECAAALLYYFERWTDAKLTAARASKSGLADLWIYGMSATRISEDMMGFFEVKSIRRALDWLVESGLLLRRNNEKDQMDKAYQYKFRINEIQAIIDAISLGTAHSLDLSHLLLGEHGHSLEGTWTCPQGQTQKSSSIDSSKEFNGANGHKAFFGGKTPGVRSLAFDSGKAAPREEQQTASVEQRQPDSSVGLKGAGSRPSPSSAAPLPLRSRKMRRDHNGIVHLPQTGKEKLASVLTIRSVQIWLACEYLDFEIGVDSDGRYYGCDPEWNEWTPEDEIFGTYAPLTKLSSKVLCKDNAAVTADEINEEIFFWFDFWRSQLASIKIGRNQRVNVMGAVSQRYELAIASVEWEDDEELNSSS